MGELLGETWRGGTFAANGKIELSGFTSDDLASSAKGTLHFEWRHGALAGDPSAPADLARFDRWTADAIVAKGKIALDKNEVAVGSRKRTVDASVTLEEPPKVTFPAPKPAQAKKPLPDTSRDGSDPGAKTNRCFSGGSVRLQPHE